MQDTSNLICNQEGCPLRTQGTCLEGVDDPHDCPHVKAQNVPDQLAAETSTEDEDTDLLAQPADWMSLSGGYELTVREADTITLQYDTRLVVFAGEPDAGKTTLMATIYELLSRGTVSQHRFAGTESILAFERACFPSRIASGNLKPTTTHTKHMRPRFYHLSLLDESDEAHTKRHFLFADISGEAFLRASDTEEEAHKLHFIKRANRFVLLLDGEKLASRTKRQDVVQRGLLVLRSLVAVGILNKQSSIQVIFSKLDCLDKTDSNVLGFLQYARDELARQYSNTFLRMTVVEIAARPQNNLYSFAFGVEDVLSSWLKDNEPIDIKSPQQRVQPQMDLREADLFLWRHPSGGV